jgi:hypothetical protein
MLRIFTEGFIITDEKEYYWDTFAPFAVNADHVIRLEAGLLMGEKSKILDRDITTLVMTDGKSISVEMPLSEVCEILCGAKL